MKPTFTQLSADKRRQLHDVIKNWKRTGKDSDVLEEGLRVLSGDDRPNASSLIAKDHPAAGFACVYGKGIRPKLSVDKDDAARLLELVLDVRRIAGTETEARDGIEKAAALVLGGERLPPETLTDERWKPLLDVLAGFDPSIIQPKLF